MKKIIIAATLIFWAFTLIAQPQRLKEFANDSTIPQWAKMMYAPKPNIGDVVTAHDAYYKTHPFQKTGYTQYYKHFLQRISRDYNGTVFGESLSNEMKKNQEDYFQKIKQNKIGVRAKSKSATSSWRCLGPFDFDKESASASYAAGAAHVYTVEQSVSNTNILYAGSANAGLWKTIDKGAHWKGCTLSDLIAEVYALEIDFSSSNTVYFSDGQKIYKTTNGGLTFNATGSAAFQNATHYTRDLKMNPQNNQVVLAACDDGLWRTDDAGQNWNLIQSGAWQELEVKTNDTLIW
ncbi:MAG: hypothetical protein RI955_657, partial [Bacteroidota bacterium]